MSLIFAAALAAQAAPPAPAPADPPPKPVAERLADLHIMYDQTCVNRAYGAYDDLCESLGDQIHRAEREMLKPKSVKAATAPAKPVEAPRR